MGLAFHFFTMMFLGILWGAIHGWNKKVSYALFLLVAAAGFVMHAMESGTGGDTSIDLVKTAIGVVGFGFGHAGGVSGYKNAFNR